MARNSPYLRLYTIGLGFTIVVSFCAMIGYALYIAVEINKNNRACFEKIVISKMPTLLEYGWAGDERTRRAEIEALSFLIIREYKPPGYFQQPEYCSQSYLERARREILGFDPKAIVKPGTVNPLVRSVVRTAMHGQYRHFSAWKHRCASTFASTLDPWPLYLRLRGTHVPVGEPIGRIQLYGTKEECDAVSQKRSSAGGDLRGRRLSFFERPTRDGIVHQRIQYSLYRIE